MKIIGRSPRPSSPPPWSQGQKVVCSSSARAARGDAVLIPPKTEASMPSKEGWSSILQTAKILTVQVELSCSSIAWRARCCDVSSPRQPLVVHQEGRLWMAAIFLDLWVSCAHPVALKARARAVLRWKSRNSEPARPQSGRPRLPRRKDPREEACPNSHPERLAQ